MRDYEERAAEEQIPEPLPELTLDQREERCEKAIKTVSKAIFMRLFVTAVLIWAVVRSEMEGWVIGLMVLVMLINLSGLLPLCSEWKKQKKLLNELIESEES